MHNKIESNWHPQPRPIRHFLHFPGALWLALALLPGFAPASRAAITELNYWRQGENDPGARNGAVTSSTTDSVGNNTLTMVGGSIYETSVATAAASDTGSSLCTWLFTAGVYGLGTLIPATTVNNFGIELWVNPTSTSGGQALAYNGNAGSNGWGIYLTNGTYRAFFGGVTTFGFATATAGTWTHLALVRNNGTATLYTNGVAAGSTTTSAPLTPTGTFGLGVNPGGGVPANEFVGYMDEVRVFTFAANAFSTSDLLINAGAPSGTISAATSITATSATLNGGVNPNGLDSTSYFSYGIGTYGTITPTQNEAASKSSGAVSATITGLAPGTHYQYLVVVANSAGENSSSGTTFTTLTAAPTATTGQASSVTGTGATLNGTVNPNGAAATNYFKYGTTQSYGSISPTNLLATGTSPVSFGTAISGLSPGTLYHFALVSVNSVGTTTGADQVFSTAGAPAIASASAISLTTSNAVLQAAVLPGQASTTVYFNYGLSTAYGLTTVATNIGSGSSSVSCTELISNLFAGVTYHFQVVAANSSGTTVSPDYSFTAAGNLSATVTTTADNLSAGSLRQAIANATNGGTINFSVTGTITLTNSLPAIFKSLTINGPGAGSLTISGSNHYRIFFVDGGSGSVNINNLTLANGNAQGGAGGSGDGGGGLGAGGALFVNSGSVILSNLNFTGNSAVGGNGGGSGGATGDYDGGGGGLGGAGGSGNGGGGGGGGGFAGTGGSAPANTGGGGGGGGFAGNGGLPSSDSGGGGGALTSGQNAATGAGGAGGASGGGTGGTSTGGQGPANGGNGVLFGGGGGAGNGVVFGNYAGSIGGNGANFGGGGGGVNSGPGGSGGDFGGGGGGAAAAGYGGAGNGGFGGGGGGGFDSGGNGGFGGGGGGNAYDIGGASLFGGSGNTSGGGGGAALGGAVFARTSNGATVTFYNASMDAGSLTGGSSAAQAGQTAGSSLFTLGGTNVITVISGTNTIAGSIAEYGSSAIAKNGAGTLVLSGNSSYSGPTLVNAGTLAVAGNISSSSALYITNGATLSGGGTVGTVNLNTGGTITPGIATLTTSNSVWTGVANYNWHIYDATNTAGVGYGTINVNGTLNLSAVTTLDVNLWSLSSLSPATSGNLINFPTLAGGSWTLVQTSGGITGFNASKCVVNKAAANGTGGFTSGLSQITFIASVAGSNLVLTPVTQPFLSGLPVTAITSFSAVLNAQVNPYNTNSVIEFLSGPTTSYGTTNIVSLGAGGGPVTATNLLSGLLAGTVYHYKIIATNALGSMAGSDQTFSTPAAAPVVATLAAGNITGTNATLFGTVNPEGAATGWYFAYGLTTSYGSATATTVFGSGSTNVAITNNITGLLPGTTYHFLVVATNSLGTNSGADMAFTTPALAPTVVPGTVSGITASNAMLNAQVTPNGAVTTVLFAWGLSASYTTTNLAAIGSGNAAVPVADLLTNLEAATTYHYKIIATNSAGVTASGDLTFSTPAGPPVAVTLGATSITTNAAAVYGTVNPENAAGGWFFQYGLTTNYGLVTVTNALAAGSVPVPVTNNLSGLALGTVYHFQLVATNGNGTSAGGDMTFTTLATPPTLVLQSPSGISYSNATLNAQVTPNGAATTVYFAWGTTTNYGTTNAVAIGGGTAAAPVADALTSLATYTTYHYLVTASNSAGVTAGSDQTFYTLNPAVNGPLTTVSYWHMGESDPGAVAGGLATSTLDSVGSDTLTINGSGAYYATNVSASAGLQAGSTLALNFSDGATYAAGYPPTSAAANFGVEGWFNQTTTPGYQFLLYNGNIEGNGWGIAEFGGKYEIVLGGVVFSTTPAAASLNVWTHVALVFAGGVATLYTNGIVAGSVNNTPNPPSGAFSIAAVFGGGGNGNYFTGLIDEVRVFTFAPGTFSTNYLLLNVPSEQALFANVSASAINNTGATLNATVSANGPAGAGAQVWFQYGLTASYGSFSATNTISASPWQAVASGLTGLQADTVYHYRVVANNGVTVASSSDQTFLTQVLAPTVTVQPVSSLTPSNATLNAFINPNEAATTVYFLWGLTAAYGQTNGANLGLGYTAVPVADALSNLLTGTIYHYEIVGSNSVGVTPSGDQVFTTLASVPSATTLPASTITSTGATLNGAVNPFGAATAAWFQYGVTTNYGSYSATNSLTATNMTLAVSILTGSLAPGTTYHFQLVAANSLGTTNGADASFTTAIAPPVAIIAAASAITATSATLNGTVNPNGDVTPAYFQYGLTTNYGSYSTTNSLTATNTALAVSNGIGGLAPDTTYHYQLVAANSAGGTNSGDASFTTGIAAPAVTTLAASGISATNATLNGTVNPNGAATAAYFGYGFSTNFTSPVIPNPSFEANTFTVGPGYASGNGGGITGWTLSDPTRIGLNPASGSPFADNGATPDGSNVAFIQSAGASAITLATTITGLVPGQTYQVSFRANGRSGYAAPMAAWSLNGGAYVPFTAWPAVGGSSPYYTNSGTFVATGATAALALRNQTNTDSTVLVDAFTVSQVGSGLTVPTALAATNVALPVAFTVTGLSPGSTYYYYLAGTNTAGTTVGGTLSFTTAIAAPTVTLLATSGVSLTNATLNGTVNPNGDATTAYFQYGVTTNYGSFSATNSLAATNALFAVANLLGSLAPGTTYHFQLVAANSAGATYGPDASFTTAIAAPFTTTLAASAVTGTNATLNGTVNPNGAITTAYFQYGLTTNYGSFSVTNTLAVTNQTLAVSSLVSNLVLGTTYHFQLVAANSVGTTGGGDLSLSTLAFAPTIVPLPVSGLSSNTATLNAQVTPNGADTVVSIQLGLTTGYGTTNQIDIGSGVTPVPVTNGLLNLATYTVYHYQIVASNAIGVTASGDLTFGTLPPGVRLGVGPLTALHYWRLGEEDPGAGSGLPATNTVDIAGTENLAVTGGGAYYSAGVAAAAANTVSSSLGLYFSNGVTSASGPLPTTVNNNFGMEGWFNPAGTSGTVLFYNGNTGNSGWGLGTTGGHYQILFGGVVFYTTAATVTTNAWVHLALVEQNGTASLYTNGVVAGSVAATPNPPSGSFAIGQTPGGGNYFTGLIDEVRIFTFAPGAFNPAWLLVNSHSLPQPAFTNVAALAVSANTVTVGATVTPNAPAGGSAQVWFQYGLTTNYDSLSATNTIAAGPAQPVTAVLSGLQPNTLYHFRAVATNGVAAGASGDATFLTQVLAPAVTWQPVSGVTGTNATLNAQVDPNEAATKVYFNWGLTAAYGQTDAVNLSLGYTAVPVADELTNLAADTVYHYQIVASNSAGVTASSDLTLTSGAGAPLVTLLAPGGITATNAMLNGTVNPNGADTTVLFIYGTSAVFTAPSLPNPSFEANTYTQYPGYANGNGGVITGWQISDGNRIGLNSAGVAPFADNGAIPDGSNVAFIQSGGNEAVTLSTTLVGLTAGQTYQVNFRANSRASTAGTNPTWSLNGGAYVPFTAAPPVGGTNPYYTNSATFLATNPTATLALRNQFNGDSTVLVDAFTVNQLSGVSVLAATNVATPVAYALAGLSPGTTYYYELTGINSAGAATASEASFTTAIAAPAVTTLAATGFSATNASLSGAVNPNGAATTAYFQYGVTTNYGSFSATNTLAATNITLAVANVIGNLAAGTTYHFQLVAVNAAGTSAGADLSVTTIAGPTVTTLAVSAFTATNATLNGTVNPGNGATTAWFQYGLTTAYGTSSATNALAATNATLSVANVIGNLAAATTYHFQLVANNGAGTTTGADLTFTTVAAPTVITLAASGVTATTATLNGTVNPGNGPTLAYFAYGWTTNLTLPGLPNPSFEADSYPSAPGYASQNGGTITGWALSDANYIGLNSTNDTAFADNGAIPDGANVAFIQSVYNEIVTLATTLTDLLPGQIYQVSFRANSRASTIAPNPSWSLNGGALVPFTAAPPVGSTNAYYTNSATFVATSTNATLVLQNQYYQDCTVLVDAFTAYTLGGGETVPAALAATNAVLPVASIITGLSPGTTYYCQLTGVNSASNVMGGVVTFTTPAGAPMAITLPASGVTTNGATLNGTITTGGFDTLAWFQYGVTTNYGNYTATNTLAATNAPLAISSLLTGLAPDTTYHYQLVGSNSAGTNAGADLTFTVPLIPPAVTTLAVSGIGATNATLNGTVNPNNATTTAWFQYGLTTAYGNIGGFTGLPATNASLTLTGLEVNSLVGVAGAQWTNSSAPGAYWQAIAASADGTKLAALENSGGYIWVSTNSGLTWTNTSAPSGYWLSIASSADGTRLVASEYYSGNIWTSTDGGLTWLISGAPAEYWPGIVSSADGTRLAALDDSEGYIWTSTNGGFSWSVSGAPSENWQGIAASADGTRLAALDGNNGYIWISTNGGFSWSVSGAPSFSWQAIAASADGTRLAAAAYGEGIYISVDGGWTWTQSDAPTDSWQGITTSADGTRLAALDGSANNIWTSTNSGVNWSVSGAPSEGWQAIAASADGTQLAAAVSGGGIYTSTGIESTLLPGTTYHFQLVGINSAGTTAGADLTFTTTSGQTPTGITLTGAVTLAGGAFQLSFTNLSGLGFTILGTTNLAVPFADWTVLGAAVESPAGSGNYQFSDTQNTNNTTEFYRVRSP